MLEVWCLIVPVLSIFLVGLPIRGLLARGKPLDEEAWIHVPFIGVAVTVLLLQLQVHLDIPVNRGVWPLWLLVLGVWLTWLRGGLVKESFRSIPLAVFAIGVAVAALHSVGLFVRGCDDYVGRSWSDQANYTAMAECFRTEGFSINPEDNFENAWLGRVAKLKAFRIGQSVLQAYHGVITRMPTRTQFMPTIFLGFPMIVLAAYTAGRRLQLSHKPALLAAFFAGLVPGVAMLGLESFQSHVWGIPFFLMLPSVLSAYGTERNLAALGTAALCLGALASIYTEFLIFELALVFAFFVLALAQRPRSLRYLLGYGLLFAAPWLCNPLYYNMSVFLTSATLRHPRVLEHIYPWAYDGLGLGVVWFGDSCVDSNTVMQTIAILIGHAVVWGGLLGLMSLAALGVVNWWRGDHRVWPRGFELILALLALTLIPSVMEARDQEHPYQYFKLLLSVSPLYPVGLVILAMISSRALTACFGNVRLPLACVRVAIWLPVFAIATVAAMGTSRMALLSAHLYQTTRTNQYVALSQEFRALRSQLESLRDQDILFQPPIRDRIYHQVWTLYFARNNRLWLTWPQHNDAYSLESLSLRHLHDFATLPRQFLVLCPRDGSYMLPPSSWPNPEIVWQNAVYVLWKYDGRPWAGVFETHNPNGDEEQIYHGIWLGGGETVFSLFASEAGVGKLRVHMHRGPCVDSSDTLRVWVNSNNGTSRIVEVEEGDFTLDFDLQRGKNSVGIEVLNPQRGAAANDPRPLLAWFQIQGLTLTPQANSVSPSNLNSRN